MLLVGNRLGLMCVVGGALLGACGGAKSTPPPAVPIESGPRPAPADGLAVSGLRGTLTQHEIDGALTPKMPKFLRCVSARLDALDVLGGELVLAFHVATDGRVGAVHPASSTLGDRDTERCMIEVARTTRFPPPHGGEADFTWPLEVPVDPDVRPPVALDVTAVRPALTAQREALVDECGGGPFAVTTYIARDGSPTSTGVAAPDGATDPELDCIARGVSSWRFEPVGSYVAKLSFSLP